MLVNRSTNNSEWERVPVQARPLLRSRRAAEIRRAFRMHAICGVRRVEEGRGTET
jgi:hypothetical protein